LIDESSAATTIVAEPEAVAPAAGQGGASAAAVNGTVYVFPGATPDVAQPSSPAIPNSISIRLSCMAALPTSPPTTRPLRPWCDEGMAGGRGSLAACLAPPAPRGEPSLTAGAMAVFDATTHPRRRRPPSAASPGGRAATRPGE